MRRTLRCLMALLLAALLLPALAEEAAPEAEATPLPETEATAAPEAEVTATPQPAKGYVLVGWGAGNYGWLPLAAEGEEYVYPLTQRMADGSTAVNYIHVTDEGVYMEASTCENQDCVREGLVTLDNRGERILGGWIVCLPNQVYLQLFTWQEVQAMYAESGGT
ncbi:MAG: NusG domain II-containing protein [Clostridia bacterium]|nr:NusG domain II-containing protein [Clostridia bacterium]